MLDDIDDCVERAIAGYHNWELRVVKERREWKRFIAFSQRWLKEMLPKRELYNKMLAEMKEKEKEKEKE